MKVMNMKVTFLAALSILSWPALAQVERSGNADARVMQQLQQMSGERAALQVENAKLKQDLEAVRKELQQATAAKTSLESRNKVLTANAGRDEAAGKQAEEQLERTREQMQELIAKFRETAQTLRDVETDRASIKTQLAQRDREFKTCVDRNAGLYNLNTEVLDRMQSRGFWSGLAEKEPFLKLKRVELENLSEDYKYRAEELKLAQQAQAGRTQ